MKTKPVIHSTRVFLGALLMFSTQLSLKAQVDGNLFPEGAFEMETNQGVPEGWAIPDKNDRPWKGGAVVSIETEEGGHFARLTTVAAFNFVSISAAVPVPEGKKKINVSARMRMIMEKVEGDWNGFKFHVGFAEEAGTGPGNRGYKILNDKSVFSLQETSDTWKKMEASIDVPENAKFVCITILVGSMLGTFDVDDVTITTD